MLKAILVSFFDTKKKKKHLVALSQNEHVEFTDAYHAGSFYCAILINCCN